MYTGHSFSFVSKLLVPRFIKITFFQDVPIIVLVFQSILVIIRRSAGPDFDKMFEVPEIIQKILEKVWGP